MKIEIPEQKKLVYEMVIPIRWGDMDAMGHLNNGTYFRYLETIRIDWMYAIGCVPDPKGEGPVIVNASIHPDRRGTLNHGAFREGGLCPRGRHVQAERGAALRRWRGLHCPCEPTPDP